LARVFPCEAGYSVVEIGAETDLFIDVDMAI